VIAGRMLLDDYERALANLVKLTEKTCATSLTNTPRALGDVQAVWEHVDRLYRSTR
jgi:hypothetical protein